MVFRFPALHYHAVDHVILFKQGNGQAQGNTKVIVAFRSYSSGSFGLIPSQRVSFGMVVEPEINLFLAMGFSLFIR